MYLYLKPVHVPLNDCTLLPPPVRYLPDGHVNGWSMAKYENIAEKCSKKLKVSIFLFGYNPTL